MATREEEVKPTHDSFPLHAVEIYGPDDVGRCVLMAQRAALQAGLDRTAQNRFATAVSELAQNVLRYAQRGRLTVRCLDRRGRRGAEAIVEDVGPGIENIELAMQESVSTGGSLGLGLPGTRRMMDDFELHTVPGKGTRVTIRLWVQR